jgi:hypothetical protein
VCRTAATTVQRIGIIDTAGLRPAQNAAVPDETCCAARGERTAAETEEEEFVSWFVVLHQEAVSVADIARQAGAKDAAADAFPTVGSNSTVIKRSLFAAIVILR